MTGRAAFRFFGQLDRASFVAFARHRAGRLSLAIEFGACSDGSVEVTVGGADVLVDAFEMAMSLGPADCLVLDVERTESA